MKNISKQLSKKERFILFLKYGILCSFILLSLVLCVESLMPGSISSKHSQAVGALVDVPVDRIVEADDLKLSCVDGTIPRKVKVGQSITLLPVFTPAATTFKQVKWTVSDEDTATISGDVITFKAPGTAFVTATSVYDDKLSDSIEFSVSAVEITAIEIDPIPALQRGYSEYLSAKILPEDATYRDITYYSDSDCVKINGNKVTALATGKALITASAGGKSDSFELDVVTIEAQSMRFLLNGESYDDLTLPQNSSASLGLKIEPLDADIFDIEWEASDGLILTFDSLSELEVTALDCGKQTITARLGDLQARLVIDVRSQAERTAILPANASFDASDMTLERGSGRSLHIIPKNIKTRLRVTEGADVVEIGPAGLIKGVRSGKAEIEVSNGSETKTVNVTVTDIKTKSLDIAPLGEVRIGKRYNLTCDVYPKNSDEELTFSVSDPAIARIKDGVLQFIKAGDVTVTATSGDIARDMKFSVNNILNIISVKGIGFNETVDLQKSTAAVIKNNSSAFFSVKYGKDATYKNIEVESSNPDVLDVSGKTLTALQPGNATVTVTYWDGNENAQKTVYTLEVTVVEQTLSDISSNYGYMIRKSIGHFGAFFVLGILAALTFILFVKNKYVSASCTFVFGFGLAGLTELLQLFTPNRYGAFSDVLLDFSGFCYAAVPIVLGFIIAWIVKYFKAKKKNEEK